MHFGWICFLWPLNASAIETQRARKDGYVVVSAAMPHSVDAVQSVLKQPGKTMRFGQSIRSVKVKPLDNGCSELEVSNKGLAKDLSYVSERCPVPGGYRSKMKSSDDFTEHDIIWTAEPHELGSLVSIRVKVALKYPVPNFVIQRIVGGALEETLKKINTTLTEDLEAGHE